MKGIVVWVVCGLFAASMVCDLRRRRIPNAIQLALLGLFAVYAATGAAGPPGVLWVHLAIGAVLLAAGFARTIVEDVRVVTIDRQVGSGADSPGGGEDGEIVRTEMMTATLEASPAQGDRLMLGEHEGRLSLAVRSLAAVTVAQNASEAEAVDLREMLLSSPEFTASEERLRRAQELNDLSIRTQIVESKKQLRAAVESGATKLEAVRIFRGSEPPRRGRVRASVIDDPLNARPAPALEPELECMSSRSQLHIPPDRPSPGEVLGRNVFGMHEKPSRSRI